MQSQHTDRKGQAALWPPGYWPRSTGDIVARACRVDVPKTVDVMSDDAVRILLLDRDDATARLLKQVFAGEIDKVSGVAWVDRLENALRILSGETYGVIMIGKGLADSPKVLDQIATAAPNALILAPGMAGMTLAMPHGDEARVITDELDPRSLPQLLPYLMRQAATAVALRQSEARSRAMSDASPLGIFVTDAEGGCVYANAAYESITALEFEQVRGTSWTASIYYEDKERVINAWNAARKKHEAFRVECRFQRWDDRSVVWVRLNSASMVEGAPPSGHVLTIEDISDRKTMESGLSAVQDDLFEERDRARVTLDSIGDSVISTDLHGKITYLNLKAEKMTGWSREEAEGRPLAEVFRIIDAKTGETAVDPTRLAIKEDRTMGLAADSVLIQRNGAGEVPIEDSVAPIHDSHGRVCGAVIVFHDVSESPDTIIRMAHLARHDVLTGLPNRVLLYERLSQALGLAGRHHKQVGVLFLDLDKFKPVNDSQGHAVGDELLKALAIRLTGCVRATDTVCRHGGDEFVVVLTEIEHLKDASRVAEKCLAVLSAPYMIRGREFTVTPSIGISVYPDDAGDADSLLQRADAAMFEVKGSGGNSYKFFKPGTPGRAARRQPAV